MTGRHLVIGGIAAAGLALFYAVVVGALGGMEHLGDQVAQDWPWIALIVAGFGTQVALFAELRRRQRRYAEATAAAGTGAGASIVGMVACCAHHVADLAPLLGASAAAVFLTDYRVPIMLLGIVINAAGVLLVARRLRRVPTLVGG